LKDLILLEIYLRITLTRSNPKFPGGFIAALAGHSTPLSGPLTWGNGQ